MTPLFSPRTTRPYYQGSYYRGSYYRGCFNCQGFTYTMVSGITPGIIPLGPGITPALVSSTLMLSDCHRSTNRAMTGPPCVMTTGGGTMLLPRVPGSCPLLPGPPRLPINHPTFVLIAIPIHTVNVPCLY